MGKIVTRKDLIKSFANKLGGAHIEWGGDDPGYEALTESGRWLRITSRTPALYELLSIGQILASSESAQRFRRRVCDLDFGSIL